MIKAMNLEWWASAGSWIPLTTFRIKGVTNISEGGKKQKVESCCCSQKRCKILSNALKTPTLQNIQQAKHSLVSREAGHVRFLTNLKQTDRKHDTDNTYNFCLDLTVFYADLTVILKPRQPAWQHRHLWSKASFRKISKMWYQKTSMAQAAGQCRWDPTHLEMYTVCSYKFLQATLGSLFHKRPGYFIEMSPSDFCLGINLLQGHGSCLTWRGNVTKEAEQQNNIETSKITSICEVCNVSIRFGCWQHSGECFIKPSLIRKHFQGYWSPTSFL